MGVRELGLGPVSRFVKDKPAYGTRDDVAYVPAFGGRKGNTTLT